MSKGHPGQSEIYAHKMDVRTARTNVRESLEPARRIFQVLLKDHKDKAETTSVAKIRESILMLTHGNSGITVEVAASQVQDQIVGQEHENAPVQAS